MGVLLYLRIESVNTIDPYEIVGYNISISLWIMLGLHVVFMQDGVYCGLNYRLSMESHNIHRPTLYPIINAPIIFFFKSYRIHKSFKHGLKLGEIDEKARLRGQKYKKHKTSIENWFIHMSAIGHVDVETVLDTKTSTTWFHKDGCNGPR